MYHIIYKTTNLITGKYYIGKHSTNSLKRNYYGSGKHLKRALRKYGKENFSIEYLFFAFSEQDAYKIEEEIVDDCVVSDILSYNLRTGGQGGNRGIPRPEPVKKKISEKLKGKKITEERLEKLRKNIPKGTQHHYYGKERDELTKNKISETLTGKNRTIESRNKQSNTMKREGNHFYGKKHSEKSKERMSLSKYKYIYTLQAPDGTITKTNNLRKYCNAYELNIGQLRNSCKAKGHTIIKRDPFGAKL